MGCIRANATTSGAWRLAVEARDAADEGGSVNVRFCGRRRNARYRMRRRRGRAGRRADTNTAETDRNCKGGRTTEHRDPLGSSHRNGPFTLSLLPISKRYTYAIVAAKGFWAGMRTCGGIHNAGGQNCVSAIRCWNQSLPAAWYLGRSPVNRRGGGSRKVAQQTSPARWRTRTARVTTGPENLGAAAWRSEPRSSLPW